MAKSKKTNQEERRKMWGSVMPGVILVFVGGVFLLNNYGVTNINIGNLWPLFIIIPGIFMIFGQHQRR